MKKLLNVIAVYLDNNFNASYLSASNSISFKIYNSFEDLVNDHIDVLNGQDLSDSEWNDVEMILMILNEHVDYAVLEADGKFVKILNV